MAYQIVSNISLPRYDLTYGSNTIELLKAWQEQRLYIGPSATSSSSSSWLKGSPSVSKTVSPPCGNCGGRFGCIACHNGGKSRRRRVSTRRRRNN